MFTVLTLHLQPEFKVKGTSRRGFELEEISGSMLIVYPLSLEPLIPRLHSGRFERRPSIGSFFTGPDMCYTLNLG